MSETRTMLERARELVEKCTPRAQARACFAYFGDHAMGVTWCIAPIAAHRDSGTLERSNFRVISRDLQERFGADCDVGRASHWAVGWIDHLEVRILADGGESVTPCGIALLEWMDKLEGYPCADDDDLSELEREEEAEGWVNFGRREFREALEERFGGADLGGVPEDGLNELWDAEPDVERDADGGALFMVGRVAQRIGWEEMAAVAGVDLVALRAGWEASELELPPYLRSARAPWEGDRVGVSLPEVSP